MILFICLQYLHATSFGSIDAALPYSTPFSVSTITLSPGFTANLPERKLYALPPLRNLTATTSPSSADGTLFWHSWHELFCFAVSVGSASADTATTSSVVVSDSAGAFSGSGGATNPPSGIIPSATAPVSESSCTVAVKFTFISSDINSSIFNAADCELTAAAFRAPFHRSRWPFGAYHIHRLHF